MAGRIIGITGGIGAGKSVVSRILRGRGFRVFDCDLEARLLMNNDLELRGALTGLCGEGIYMSDGTLNRRFLASLIFNDEIMRNKVNVLVHGVVRREFLKIAEAEEKGPTFVEAAIMGSSGLARLCDEVWVVHAPDNIRFERAMTRGGITEEDMKARMDAQKSELLSLAKSGVKIRFIDNATDSGLIERIDVLLS